MSENGKDKFERLYHLLIKEGFNRIDPDTDLYEGSNGFYLQVGSSGGGDGWVVNLWNPGAKHRIYWDYYQLVKRLEELPVFERIK